MGIVEVGVCCTELWCWRLDILHLQQEGSTTSAEIYQDMERGERGGAVQEEVWQCGRVSVLGVQSGQAGRQYRVLSCILTQLQDQSYVHHGTYPVCPISPSYLPNLTLSPCSRGLHGHQPTTAVIQTRL